MDESTDGQLTLISAGGEATVFFDERSASAIKLFAPPCKATFGWVIERNAKGRYAIRASSMAEALVRFARFEELFLTGLELDQIGTTGDFLVLRQPFILGEHPDEQRLHNWMHDQGWKPFVPPTDLAMLHNLSWQRDGFIATDVRPENALIAEADGEIRAIDYIIGTLD